MGGSAPSDHPQRKARGAFSRVAVLLFRFCLYKADICTKYNKINVEFRKNEVNESTHGGSARGGIRRLGTRKY